jgi:hypothetical protein
VLGGLLVVLQQAQQPAQAVRGDDAGEHDDHPPTRPAASSIAPNAST